MVETYFFAGGLTSILIDGAQTGGRFSLHRTEQASGGATPPHVHDREDETVFVLAGELTVETNGRSMSLREGQTYLLPRGVPHRLSNRGAADVAYIVFCTPAGFDDFVRQAGTRVVGASPGARPMSAAEAARLIEVMERFGIHRVEEDAL
jgi:mannose-6-phosphate isomerase-like protein (cupin superfamily)